MALRAGRVGVNPADVNPIDGHIKEIVYSSDPVKIGVTSEGKDINQVLIETTTPSEVSVSTVIGSIGENKEIIFFDGSIVSAGGIKFPINFKYSDTLSNFTSISKGTGDISMILGVPGAVSQKCFILIIYTEV